MGSPPTNSESEKTNGVHGTEDEEQNEKPPHSFNHTISSASLPPHLHHQPVEIATTQPILPVYQSSPLTPSYPVTQTYSVPIPTSLYSNSPPQAHKFTIYNYQHPTTAPQGYYQPPQLLFKKNPSGNAPNMGSTPTPTTSGPSPSEKSKPSIIPVARLQIGSWVRRSAFLGDIFCKFYYKKKQLVWEMMGEPMGYLRKMVVNFSEVTRIDFHMPMDKPSVMTIQVSKPPNFFREVNPQPGKNVQWVGAQDFTGGQALISSKHILYFSKNTLNKHLSKLTSDESLKGIIVSNGFPASNSPSNPPNGRLEEDDEDEDDDDVDESPHSNQSTISPLLLHQ